MIDVQNVRFTYDGANFALDGVSLHVRKGEFLCILGGNGSGKSTLAKHLNALLIPDEGTVKVQDMPTADADCTYRIRETVGMVFQNPDDQLVASLVEDDVAFGPENLGVPTDELRERVTQALEDVGLSGFERHETHALSGGQKQRVAIAGVLAMNPAVLVLDEASAMLDPRGRAGLMRVCHELHERGMTIVMITHYMEEAAKADRVVVMERGHVALEGTPDEVLVQARALAHLNLDVPFAARLLLDLRDAGMAVQPTVDAGKLAREVLALGKAVGICTTADANAAAPDEADADIDFPTCEGDADAPALIEFQDVSFTYDAAEAKRQRKRKQAPATRQAKWGNSPDSLWAVRDVSLQVRRGEFLGVAGHTGSGKSTLIQHMNGILKPTSGRVLIDGTDIASKGAESKVRGSIGVVFQYPEHQLFAETVYKDVAFGPRNLGLSGEEVDALVRSSLERVGLSFDELAEKINGFEVKGMFPTVTGDNLKATIEKHNGYIDNGEDLDFHKVMASTMVKIEEGPYYALPQFPSVHHTMGGLVIDTMTRVLDIYGQPIEGLYAAGEVTGGVHGTNRLGSNADADACGFGYISGIVVATGELPDFIPAE